MSLKYSAIKTLGGKVYKYRKIKRQDMDRVRKVKSSKFEDYSEKTRKRVKEVRDKNIGFGAHKLKSVNLDDPKVLRKAFDAAKGKRVEQHVKRARRAHQKAREHKEVVKKSDWSLNKLQESARAKAGERTHRTKRRLKAHWTSRPHKGEQRRSRQVRESLERLKEKGW